MFHWMDQVTPHSSNVTSCSNISRGWHSIWRRDGEERGGCVGLVLFYISLHFFSSFSIFFSSKVSSLKFKVFYQNERSESVLRPVQLSYRGPVKVLVSNLKKKIIFSCAFLHHFFLYPRELMRICLWSMKKTPLWESIQILTSTSTVWKCPFIQFQFFSYSCFWYFFDSFKNTEIYIFKYWFHFNNIMYEC